MCCQLKYHFVLNIHMLISTVLVYVTKSAVDSSSFEAVIGLCLFNLVLCVYIESVSMPILELRNKSFLGGFK